MRKIVIIGFAAGLLAAPLPAQAADTNAASNARSEAAPPPAQANGAPARARQICVRDTRSETRIPRQICHTAREWRDLQGEVPGER
jgi:hypothetical protein